MGITKLNTAFKSVGHTHKTLKIVNLWVLQITGHYPSSNTPCTKKKGCLKMRQPPVISVSVAVRYSFYGREELVKFFVSWYVRIVGDDLFGALEKEARF